MDGNSIRISIYKEIVIFGIKLTLKTKKTQYERFILNSSEDLLLLKDNILESLDYISGNIEVQEVLESDNPEDKLTVSNLYKNLDVESENNLNQILERNKRVVNYTKYLEHKPKSYEVYTKEELKAYEKIINFKKEIKVYNDFFEWQNYKLPVNFFEPLIFLNNYGANILKNKNAVTEAIIDVGANIGDSAIVLRNNFPNSKIICFEPEQKNFNLCKKTAELNNIENIIIEKIGLGDTTQSSNLSRIGTLGIGSRISEGIGEKINITTLDDYVKKNNIKVGLIKVDIEGYEPNFIRGAQETIRTQAPVILLSIYHTCSDFYMLKPMIEEIMKNSEFKYRYNFFQPVGNDTILDTLLICERV